jgi:hypothetical protein
MSTANTSALSALAYIKSDPFKVDYVKNLRNLSLSFQDIVYILTSISADPFRVEALKLSIRHIESPIAASQIYVVMRIISGDPFRVDAMCAIYAHLEDNISIHEVSKILHEVKGVPFKVKILDRIYKKISSDNPWPILSQFSGPYQTEVSQILLKITTRFAEKKLKQIPDADVVPDFDTFQIDTTGNLKTTDRVRTPKTKENTNENIPPKSIDRSHPRIEITGKDREIYSPRKQLTTTKEERDKVLNDVEISRAAEVNRDKREPGPSGDDNMCVICLENSKNVLLTDCRHLCLCGECIHNIEETSVDNQGRETKTYKCPLCRKDNLSHILVFN